jgi:hypothetical protein
MQLSQAVHQSISASRPPSSLAASSGSARDWRPMATMSQTPSRMFLLAQYRNEASSRFTPRKGFFPSR